VYFNNPIQYVGNLNDDYYLPTLQKADSIVIVTGQGAFEAPERTKQFCGVLTQKGIPHLCEFWGHDVKHDWDWWRKMLPYYLDRFFS
jgi:esterase/lipase superfamily enzyme